MVNFSLWPCPRDASCPLIALLLKKTSLTTDIQVSEWFDCLIYQLQCLENHCSYCLLLFLEPLNNFFGGHHTQLGTLLLADEGVDHALNVCESLFPVIVNGRNNLLAGLMEQAM